MAIILAKQGSVQAFGYEILFTKAGEQQAYDMSRLCVETAIYESLFQKAVTMQTSIYDGAGFMDKVGIDIGDTFQLTLYKDVNTKPRVLKKFRVVGVTAGARATAAKAYTVNCISELGYNDIGSNVRRSLRGTIDSICKTISNTFLKTPITDADTGSTSLLLIGTGQTAFEMIDACSVRSGGEPWFYFETLDNTVNFQSIKTIAKQGEVHQYILTSDKSEDKDGTDYYRIANMKQTKHKNLHAKQNDGLLENQFFFIDPLNRTVKKGKQFDYSTMYTKTLLLGGKFPLETEKELVAVSSKTHQQDDRVPQYSQTIVTEEAFERKEPMAVDGEQRAPILASLNQLSYTLLVLGNPAIQAGDIIQIAAPALTAQSSTNSFDSVLHGKWLVGNVRHVITSPESYMTTIDVFRNSFDTQRSA